MTLKDINNQLKWLNDFSSISHHAKYQIKEYAVYASNLRYFSHILKPQQVNNKLICNLKPLFSWKEVDEMAHSFITDRYIE